MLSESKHAMFARHPFFRGLPPADLERVLKHAHAASYGKGEVIFAKGDEGRGLLAVLAGRVKISVLSSEGQEIIFDVLGEGHIFGEIALLDGGPRTGDATALDRCELLVLERRDFLPLLRVMPDLSIQLMQLLCQRLRRTSEQVEDLMFLDLSARLAKTLLRLAGPQSAPVRMTQQGLGELIGLSRESTNKQLRAWQEKGWVRLEKGVVFITNARALGARLASPEVG